MYNQMNFVFNHSDKLEALGTQYYELLFKTGVIANRMTENHAQGLKAGEKGAGGYLVPDSMEAQIVQTLAEDNVMRRLATVIHMEDGERAVPVVRSMSEAQWLDENEAMEMGAAGFEAAHLKPRKVGLAIPVSNELLADAGVDMAAFLTDSFARHIASSEEKAFLTGDGAKQPAGLLNSAQVGVTAAAPNALTADEIISLYYTLDEQYRAKAVFLMHEDTAKALRTLKDENGRYLWREALGGEPDRLLGRPEGASEKLITYVTDRAGHDLRYAIDSRKLKEELGWEPSLQFEEGIEKTVRWYLANQEWMDDITSGEYERYYQEMYTGR